VVAVDALDAAYALKAGNPGWILAGERGGEPCPGFDTGNSPTLLREMDVEGSTIVLTTSAGTQGIVRASARAPGVLIACFANASAAARLVLESNAGDVGLLCMGNAGVERAVEDDVFADYFTGLLTGKGPHYKAALREVERSGAGERLLRSKSPSCPPGDYALCMELDSVPLVPVVDGTLQGFPVLHAPHASIA